MEFRVPQGNLFEKTYPKSPFLNAIYYSNHYLIDIYGIVGWNLIYGDIHGTNQFLFLHCPKGAWANGGYIANADSSSNNTAGPFWLGCKNWGQTNFKYIIHSLKIEHASGYQSWGALTVAPSMSKLF